jgi:bifunctional ADP-heptose synthase (sugar kinase/adenylyltransferase)
VVGLNSDASVRRAKGPTRPVNHQYDRAFVLGSLRAVDYVVNPVISLKKSSLMCL